MARSRFAALAPLLASALLAAPALAAPAMTVSYTAGNATVASPGGAAQPVIEGQELHEGDTIRTTAGARVEVELATGSILRIGASTTVELHAESEGRSFRARLTLGNLWAKVQKLLGSDKFEVETQNGVAGVRGTEFRVLVSKSGAAMVRVYEGKVWVKGAAFEHVVTPGQEIRFKTKSLGPRPFEAKGEKSPFMRWVREKGEGAGRRERGSDHGSHHPDRAEHPEHEREPKRK